MDVVFAGPRDVSRGSLRELLHTEEATDGLPGLSRTSRFGGCGVGQAKQNHPGLY